MTSVVNPFTICDTLCAHVRHCFVNRGGARRSCASALGAWRADRGHFSSADPEVISLHCNVCFEALQLTPAHFFGMNARFVSLRRPDADNRRLSACWERMWKCHCDEPSENHPVPRWQSQRGSEQLTYTCCWITLIQLAGNVINQWRLSFICMPQCSSNQIIVLQGCRIKLLSCGKQLPKKKKKEATFVFLFAPDSSVNCTTH